MGSEVYIDTHLTRSNSYGLINLPVGLGIIETGGFTAIKWGTNSYFIKMEAGFNGGTDYQMMGTSRLYSVLYAFYAESAGSLLAKEKIQSRL